MSTVTTRDAVVHVVDRTFAAIEQGDMAALRRCFAPGAAVWHNYDDIAQDLDAVIVVLGTLCAVTTGLAYEIRHRTVVGRTVFQEHLLTGDLVTGDPLRLYAMMRIEVDGDGLICGIDEYLDSRAADGVGQAATAAG